MEHQYKSINDVAIYLRKSRGVDEDLDKHKLKFSIASLEGLLVVICTFISPPLLSYVWDSICPLSL